MNLLFGDCLLKMREIPDRSIDMVLCDLPYGTTQNKWDTVIDLPSLWAAYRRICKGAVVLTAQQPFTSILTVSNLKGFRYQWIWEKTNATGFLNARKAPLKCHETVLVFYDKPATFNPQKTKGHVIKRVKASYASHGSNYGKSTSVREPYESTERFPRDVQLFAKDNRLLKLHPNRKPVALMEYLIKTDTNIGMTVLDNCMGSGTTGVACINTGRDFIGIENDLTFFESAQSRILTALGETQAACDLDSPSPNPASCATMNLEA